MDKIKNVLIICLLILQMSSICVFYNIDNIELFQKGLRYQLYSMNYSISYQTIKEDVNFDIDISNLNSNKDKIIYRNEECSIKIDSVIKENKKYIIYFSSHGNYDRYTGKLITGVKHKILSNKTIKSDIEASCFVNGIKCDNNSISGINFKDGDEFSFMFDQEIAENNANITLKNLILIKMEKI